MKITAKKARYIKLGKEGKWERDSIEKGIIKFGFGDVPHDLCQNNKWDEVHAIFCEVHQDKSNPKNVATNSTRQVRDFYQADESWLFITFFDYCMYWCRPAPGVSPMKNGRWRETLEGWRKKSIGGTVLSEDTISGHILQTKSYRATLCEVRDINYLLCKINDIDLPKVTRAKAARVEMEKSTLDLIRRLTWQDFEQLVELLFSRSGWQRLTPLGKVQKDIDFSMMLPTTGEKASVQIKSKATPSDFQKYQSSDATRTFQRKFYTWHTGSIGKNPSVSRNMILLPPERIATMVIDAGLLAWLMAKVS